MNKHSNEQEIITHCLKKKKLIETDPKVKKKLE